MTLSDCGDATFEERLIHFRKQLGLEGERLRLMAIQKPQEFRDLRMIAQEQATAEMLNEVHVMLRELLKRVPKGG